MSVMAKRWYRSRRNQMIIFIIIIVCIAYYFNLHESLQREPDLDLTRRYIEDRLQEALKDDKGLGCEMPKLNPFNQEVTQFDKDVPKIVCSGIDWVKCYHSKCRVVPEILKTMKNIVCRYSDIVYDSDMKHHLSPSMKYVMGYGTYTLMKSDHVKVSCTATHIKSFAPTKWVGFATGFRISVEWTPPPPGRENTLNVLIFGFDSTSKNAFIRRLPKSYKYLTEVMKANVLNGYNIVGDGTPAALFPILTGKTELELPDVRKSKHNNLTLDIMPFIFYKLKDDGYRTAYFEDMPWIGTFQYRFNGFRNQPADHYLRAFYLEVEHYRTKWWGKKGNKEKYCLGDTPQHALMMNLTDQFLESDGKKFIFTFIADITHDDFNMLSTADDATLKFFKGLVKKNVMENTLVIIMGDHGARFGNIRGTFQGKLEERLAMMALILPEKLKRNRPEVQAALEANINALTTPHDIYATILDVLDMKHHWNTYKVTGADLPRGMTLLESIPRNRSCSEAGIEPHWCACLTWHNVSDSEPVYHRTARAFVKYINSLTESVRSQCVERELTAIHWVMRQQANKRMLSFAGAKDADGYLGKFNGVVKYTSENFQIKVEVSPGRGIYEASLQYRVNEDKLVIDSRDISRTNAYGEEPSCISATHPHLNPYCYCADYLGRKN